LAAKLDVSTHGIGEVIDLRRVNARDLDVLLQEECASWLRELSWDFTMSADLVRRFVEMRALTGSALLVDGEVAGYMYYVVEEDKGLIGDVYVRQQFRTVERENLLLATGLVPMMDSPGVTRIEAQLMMLQYDRKGLAPRPDCLSMFERNFMRIDLMRNELAKGNVRRPVYIEKWSDHYHDAAANLIAAAYAGHVDSRINDQYRTPAGARRFLHNIVVYPGCGTFNRGASYVAFEGVSGALCGISLASQVTEATGHVTQICVSPNVRGTGVGHELLRQTLGTLRGIGCSTASLTVTAANDDAVSLYERVGFETIRRFWAYVWEGF
jgi:ribosomal protein S18 acetylase RimI-like enzyme